MLRNSASGPEIVDFGDLNGPLLPQNLLEKVGGLRPTPFPVGFAVGGGHLDPQNKRSPAPGQKPGITPDLGDRDITSPVTLPVSGQTCGAFIGLLRPSPRRADKETGQCRAIWAR